MDYSYLNNTQFVSKYAISPSNLVMDFYLENIKCSKCINKIEKESVNNPNIKDIVINLSTHIARVSIHSNGKFSLVANFFYKLGFTPHPIASKSDLISKQKKVNKKNLNRLAVTGVLMGNIMLFSFSNYSGATNQWSFLFDLINGILFLGIILYSSWPFYQNSYLALRQGKASIDFPIVTSLIAGATISYYHLFKGKGDIYFDSLAMLIFLILTSRLILHSYQKNLLDPAYLKNFFNFKPVLKLAESKQTVLVPSQTIKKNDIIIINEDESLPVDGLLQNSNAWFDTSVNTGEFLPTELEPGNRCYAGYKSLNSNTIIKATSCMDSSDLGLLIAEVESQILKKTPLTSLTDKVAQYFTLTVITVGLLFLSYYMFINFEESINRTLALFILACPCALAFATPLSQSLSLSKLAKKGILVKKAEAFEKLTNIDTIVFDKTGTLSIGSLQFLGWDSTLNQKQKSIIYSLEQHSKHPVAKALKKIYSDYKNSLFGLTDFKETLGEGVSGFYKDDFYELKSVKIINHKTGPGIGFFKNKKCLATARFGDIAKVNTSKTIHNLANLGLNIFIISGDKQESVNNFAKHINVPPQNVYSEMSPKDKSEFIKAHPNSLMVGDGANDLLALSGSSVSATVKGGLESCLKISDIYLNNDDIHCIFDLVKLSKETMRVIKRNLSLSLIYNSIGAAAALFGYITPLVAAILMPLSSTLVVLSAIYGTSWIRKFSKRKLNKNKIQIAINTLTPLRKANV